MASTNTSNPHVYVIWVAFLLFIGSLQPSLCFSGNGSGSGSCIERERMALLRIRKGICGADRWLSWNGKDCCRWRGVRCHTMTGHVVKLDLHNPGDAEYPVEFYCAESEVSPSLLHLRHLNHLDLSMNNFGGAPIPDFIGSLTDLEYLNLFMAGFGGTIPHQLGNLSNLLYLDLSTSDDWCSLDVDNLGWLAQIHSIQHLDMSYVNLSKASNWIHVINMLPSLSVLRLSHAALSSLPSTLPFVNFTSLATLDLSENYFASSTPGWLFNVSSLEHLDVGYNSFDCNIPLAIGNLKKLQDLDLSNNNFSGDIPETVWSLKSLRSIYLNRNNFNGCIPETIGNLKKLRYLDLSDNNFGGDIPERVWSLKSLRSINLNWNNFNGAIPEAVGNLDSLESLELRKNNINGEIPKTIGNLTKLHSLDLSNNVINGRIPETVGNLHHLEELYLSNNSLTGVIPRTVGNLCNLSYFDASMNNLSGEITGFMEGFSRCISKRLQYPILYDNYDPLPSQIGELQSLEFLRLSVNSLNGSIPASLGKLYALSVLDLSSNSLSGALTEAHFANLTSLLILDISHNSLTVNVSQDWLPPFKAQEISMSSCQLGPKFPSWLQNQTDLYLLDLSNVGISENFPNWFWDMRLPIMFLNISHNQMKGKLPTPTEERKGKLHGSGNLVSSEISYPPSILAYIDLSNNLFSGPIPPTLLGGVAYFNVLFLAYNRISGSIPSAFCETKYLQVLDLANNDLSGVLPDCWNNSLEVIDFSYNKLSGDIPSSMGSLSQLMSLHLRNNNLSGKIPLSLQQCKQLITLDLGNNKLSGSIPEWIGENLLSLRVLCLRSNMLDGNIPKQLSLIASLQVLDLANNKLSGTLPPSFGNFRAMTVMIPNGSSEPILSRHVASYYIENFLMTMKGEEHKLITTVLSLVTSIDLSNNNISGEIPEGFTNLHGLHSLNLSGNHLTGSIPKNIGAMGQLESLDLSMNNLSSTIPASISNLNFLEHLNLSFNNLSGRIPSGNQLQTLNDLSIYIGNQYLCGQPLLKKCPGDKLAGSPTSYEREEKGDENDLEMIWFYVSLSLGFMVGFWGFLGAMMLKKSIRYAYIRFIDRICDWIYMAVTINSARPKSKKNQGCT